MHMKSRVTLTINPEVRHLAKREAKRRNMSLSAMIETLLHEATSNHRAAISSASFSQRWQGKLKLENRSDRRFAHLAKKYELS